MIVLSLVSAALIPDQPNILVEDSGRACIADFGLAKVTKNPNSLQKASSQNGFTARWVAPEVWDQGEYSKKSDTFSFAMVMIEVRRGAIPRESGVMYHHFAPM